MSLRLLSADESRLAPEIVSVGTCRALRIRRVGNTYFLENNQLSRDGVGATSDNWKVVVVVKPDRDPKAPSAHDQAHRCLANANKQVLDMIEQDMRRKADAAARGAN